MVKYIVQPGDTLSKIASKYDTSVQAIIGANGIMNPQMIYTGQILRIPTTHYNDNNPYKYKHYYKDNDNHHHKYKHDYHHDDNSHYKHKHDNHHDDNYHHKYKHYWGSTHHYDD